MRWPVVVGLGLGCGAPAAGVAPHHEAPNVPTTAAPLHVTAQTLPGWLAFATRAPSPDHGDWIPTAAAPVVVPVPDDAVLARDALLVTADAPIAATVTARDSIPYGCDNNQLAVVDVQVPTRPAIGVVWVLPAPLPAGWAPRALALDPLHVRGSEAVWRAGPLELKLAVVDHDHAALGITRAGRQLAVQLYEREAMDGDDTVANVLDLTAEPPGIALPVAAWQLAPGGPIVLALRTPDHEGNSLSTMLIDDDTAQPASLAAALYLCAF